MKILFKSFFGLIMISIMHCSSTTYTIVDRTGLEVDLTTITLTEEKYFEVLDGESYRKIPVSAIEKMTIDPTVTFSFKGKLFFQTAILLVDGTQIKPRTTENGRIKSFVCIENSIRGSGKTGELFLQLEDLNMVRKNLPI